MNLFQEWELNSTSLQSLKQRGDVMRIKGHLIENETQLKNKLDLIYQKAKEEKSCFHGIIELMKNKQTIKTAIHNIKIVYLCTIYSSFIK